MGSSNHGRKYTIKAHKLQAKSRAMQSHHVESQTAAKRAVANYDAGADPTILLPEKQHQKTFGPQAQQRQGDRAEAATGAGPGHDAKIGRSESVRNAANVMKKAGVPDHKANEAALKHDGYMKGTTPLSGVRGAIKKFWSSQSKSAPPSKPGTKGTKARPASAPPSKARSAPPSRTKSAPASRTASPPPSRPTGGTRSAPSSSGARTTPRTSSSSRPGSSPGSHMAN